MTVYKSGAIVNLFKQKEGDEVDKEKEPNVRLGKARRMKGLTQKELASRTGVTRLWIHDIEKNGRVPSLEVAKKIASVLDVTVDDIF